MLPLLALAGLPALAFQPSDKVHIGQEPTRIRRVHVERQHALRHDAAWRAFTKGAGHGWQAVFDERTGTPHRAWGPGIPLGSIESGDAAAAALRDLLADHAELTGVPVGDLRLGHAIYDDEDDRWFVRLDQVVAGDNQLWGGEEGTLEHFASHGQPVVWRGAVEAWIQHGKLSMLSVDTVPQAADLDPTPAFGAEEAIARAIADGPEPYAAHDVDGAVLVVLPLEAGGGIEARLTWMVRSRTGGGAELPGQWVSFVDAHTGELLNVHNQVRYASGTVYGRHDRRTVDGDMAVSPLPWLTVTGSDGSEVETDLDGAWALGGVTGVSTDLDGAFFQVRNDAGGEGSLSWTNGDVTWDAEDATQAEIDTYVFLNRVRTWATVYAYDVPLTTDRIRSTVNIDDSCNAYYDGNVNFFQKGGGCNNTGRIADVNYHEWGHGVHYSAAASYYLDGAVGEGAGDTLANMLTDDPVMAPYFMESGSGIREVESNRRFPDDVVGEVHTDGLIYAGAMWDTRAELESLLGGNDGYDLHARLFIKGLQYNPELDETYDAMVAADDDDGDLSNGTPHQCEILDGFSQHGLGPGGASALLDVSHEVVDNQPGGIEGYDIEADLVNLAPTCVELGEAAGDVVFSVDGGDTWDSAPLQAGDGVLVGAIPGVEAGSIVHYYIDAEADGSPIRAPQGGDINPTSFAVGDLEEVYFQSFEGTAGGYTSELVSGEDVEGADDWQWGTPVGLAGDPDFCFSGDGCWGNDLGGERNGQSWNGEYQNDKVNRLSSPSIEVPSDERLVVQFRRWLNVEDGFYDQARVLIDGEEVWTNHATRQSQGDEHHQDAQWALETIEVPAELAADGEIVISWEIRSDAGLTFGGWNLDDVGVYTLTSTGSTDPGGDDGVDLPDEEGAGADEDTAEFSACGCASTGPAPAGLAVLGIAGLALLRRRRED